MSYDDFCRCTPSQFRAVMAAHRDESSSKMRLAWERARWQALIMVQPHVSKRLDMKKDLPLPWDDEDPHRPKLTPSTAPQLSKEQRLSRLKELLNRRS